MTAASTLNRETWLNLLAAKLAPILKEKADLTVPAKLRLSCGFTSSKRAIGECHYAPGSADETTEVFVHPGQAEPAQVAQIVIHELIHAALGPGHGHGKVFGKAARAMGLAGKLTATYAGPDAEATIAAVLADLPPYPHARLGTGRAEDAPKPQSGKKHINLNCPQCEFHAKVLLEQRWMGDLRCPADGEVLTNKKGL